jgi:putative alpha-1,2-mannosidase
MEVPWAYHYVGRPDRTAEVVHAVLSSSFAPGRGGLPGNDDSGGLSSWYVWATLGLFPVAGQGICFVNAPAVDRSRIRVRGGDLVVEARGRRPLGPGATPQYVQAATLDGETLERSWLTARELHRPGHLVVELGDEPSEWGRARRPPSGSSRVVVDAGSR